MVKKIIVLFLSLFIMMSCYSQQMAIEQIEADNIEYKGKNLILTGNVRVKYSFGAIRCDKASLDLAKGGLAAAGSGPEKILLEGHVQIDFPDGDRLDSDRADINTTTMDGVFDADAPNKVTYLTTMGEGDQKVPVKASSKKLTAHLSKDGESGGYHLADLKGEGAVFIEYLKPPVVKTQKPE